MIPKHMHHGFTFIGIIIRNAIMVLTEFKIDITYGSYPILKRWKQIRRKTQISMAEGHILYYITREIIARPTCAWSLPVLSKFDWQRVASRNM